MNFVRRAAGAPTTAGWRCAWPTARCWRLPACAQRSAARRGATSAVVLGVRPEHMSRALPRRCAPRPGALHAPRSSWCSRPASRTYATFKLGGAEVVAELQAHDVSQPGERVELAIDMNRAVLIDPATEAVIS